MGFLSTIFQPKQLIQNNVKTVITSKTSDTEKSCEPKSKSSTSKSKSSKRKAKSRNKDKVSAQVMEKPEVTPPQVLVCQTMMEKVNNWKGPEDFLILFTSEDARITCEDGVSFNARQFSMITHSIMESAPDLRLNYSSIETTGPGKASIEGIVVSGTHTGAPFSPMPGVPPVEAKGKHFVLDEERDLVELDMDTNKISSIHIISLGTQTGPVGLYELIGGKMGPPPP